MRRGIDVGDALCVRRTQVENSDDSAAVDVAIGNYARAAGQIELERCAGKRDYAVVEPSGIARPSASRVARGCNSVDAAQIVRSLVPGVQPKQKALPLDISSN